MPPPLESILAACPGLDERFAREHLSRLDESYFGRFGADDICRHIGCISRLTHEHCVEILVTHRTGSADITVLSFDFPSVFSIITGILASSGFNIQHGDVFTYSAYNYSKQPQPRTLQRRPPVANPMVRRRIIDYFSGVPDPLMSPEDWKRRVTRDLEDMIGLLEHGGAESALKAKRRINEMVAGRLSSLHSDTDPVLHPVSIEVDNTGAHTHLRVTARDTPAFLYSLSNALSLAGTTIEGVTIRTREGRVEDTIDVADAQAQKSPTPARSTR